MRVVDAGSSSGDKIFGTIGNISIPREVYNRLQLVPMFQIGSLVDDSKLPLKAFFDAMNNIQEGTNTDVLAEQVNVFLGSIGVDFYYPHPDNNYKGELGNA